MALSLSDLRALVRQRADMESTTFVTDAEVNRYINQGYKNLWSFLVATYGSEYFVQVACGTTTANCSAMDMPVEFFKLVAVFWDKSSTEKPRLRSFDFAEFMYDPSATWSNSAPRYRLAHNSLIYTPTPDAAYSMELWFVPQCDELSGNGDTVNSVAEPWSEYLVLEAAIKCLSKEESDISALQAERAALREAIETTAPPRDLGEPATIQDVRAYGETDRDWWWQ